MVSKFYLFAPVVKEIIKTYVENGQSLIMEGCYIPFGREKDFADDYQCDIKYICLIFSEEYIRQHFADIVKSQKYGRWFKEQFGRLFSSVKRTVEPLRRGKGMGL